MKLAVIGPTSCLTPNMLSMGYHMALGQELVRDTTYLGAYRHLVRAGRFVIVDNGAAEPEDEREDFDKIVEVALDIGADEIILPDVIRDPENTIIESIAHADKVPPIKRMVVPQGESWDEWRTCLDELTEYCEPRTIGIAKHTERFPGGRAYACQIIKERGYHHEYHIHLLGVWQLPYQEALRCAMVLPYIRGIDTGAPIAYAQRDMPMKDEAPHYSLRWEPPTTDSYIGMADLNTMQYRRFLADVDRKVKYLET